MKKYQIQVLVVHREQPNLSPHALIGVLQTQQAQSDSLSQVLSYAIFDQLYPELPKVQMHPQEGFNLDRCESPAMPRPLETALLLRIG
ncbi:MAG: hypothetical protein JAY97_11025 [Candidatus Thiodiazotropha sp. 'RUGA']|nr:hypothetical protein [Candidatus Thiodiazotropha sp. 'RUGA']